MSNVKTNTNYRGKSTEQCVESLFKFICKVIMTLSIIFNVIFFFKVHGTWYAPEKCCINIWKNLCSKSIELCWTDVQTFAFRENISWFQGNLRKHFEQCDIYPSEYLFNSNFSEKRLTLESLFIEEIKPQLNLTPKMST